MIDKCDKCKKEKKIVSRVFLFEGDEEPLFQYCADCMRTPTINRQREGKRMKLIKSIELLGKYLVCPECGNEHIGNGEGTLEIEENLFRRTCKCGWIVEIRDLPDESTAYGICPTGKCEM